METVLFKPSVPPEFCSQKVGSVCRICLQTHIPLFSIFRDNIDEMISEFVLDKVDEQDNVPHQICKKCLEDLKIAYAFKKQTEYSHEVIKNLLCGKRLSRTPRKKICKELTPPNISSLNSNIKTYFQCHICERNMKRQNLLKMHLEKMHKCFEFNEHDNKEEKVKNLSENEIEAGLSSLLLDSIKSDGENEIKRKGVSEGRKDDVLKTADEYNTCNPNTLNSENIRREVKHRKLNDISELDIKPKIVLLPNANGKKPIEEVKSSSATELLGKSLEHEYTNLNDDISSDYQGNNSSNICLDVSKTRGVKPNKIRPKIIDAYVCHICEKEFSSKTITRRHLKNIHKFENFEDDIWLSKVYQKTVEAKIYECEICKKVYAKTQDLFRHQLTHSGNSRAKPHCSKSFLRSNHLKIHMNGVHADLRPFKCLTCEKSFRRTEHLKRHVLICSTGRKRRAREPTEHRFSCEVCLRKFSTEKAVRYHIDLKHNESRLFSCKYCSENIIGSTEYKNHCKEHYKTSKQFLCSVCGNSFATLQYLKSHLKRHAGEKPFKCQYCDKTFFRPVDQHAHERLHRGEKNCVCSECSKAFATKYKLRVHMRVHLSERPYKCTSCSKSFLEKSNLTKHLKQHNSERFYCNLCKLSYAQLCSLKRHKRDIHEVIEPGGRVCLLKIQK